MTNYEKILKMRNELTTENLDALLLMASGENNADATFGHGAEFARNANGDYIQRDEWACVFIRSMESLLSDADSDIREFFEKTYDIKP